MALHKTDGPVTEDDIREHFLYGPVPLLDAIMALQEIGYDSVEAERIVFEWLDSLEQDQDGETI